MKLKCRLTADVIDYHRKRTADGETEATIALEFSLKREEVGPFGADFEAVSFALMRIVENEDGEKSVSFLAKSVKPDSSVVVLENHRIAIDGETFDVALDGVRLSTQLATVRRLMSSGGWWTLARLREVLASEGIPASEAGISARLRDLRGLRDRDASDLGFDDPADDLREGRLFRLRREGGA